MDDARRREAAGRGHDALAGLDRALRHRLALDDDAGARLDRPGDARSHPEGIVGRVDDRIRAFRRDVAADDLQGERGDLIGSGHASDSHALRLGLTQELQRSRDRT